MIPIAVFPPVRPTAVTTTLFPSMVNVFSQSVAAKTFPPAFSNPRVIFALLVAVLPFCAHDFDRRLGQCFLGPEKGNQHSDARQDVKSHVDSPWWLGDPRFGNAHRRLTQGRKTGLRKTRLHPPPPKANEKADFGKMIR